MKPRVIVLGAGAAGLAAAIAAAHEGGDVVLYEATDKVGGTTALSGGVAWVPNNHRAAEAGFEDSREAGLTYLRTFDLGDVDDELIERFVDHGPQTMKRLEERTPIRWAAVGYPDYHCDRDGGRLGGRSMEAEPFAAVGRVAELLRDAPNWADRRATQRESLFGAVDPAVIADRAERNVVTIGRGMVAALLQGALDAGVDIRVGTRITQVVRDGDRVVGVETPDGIDTGAVILATGGFERDEALAKAFLRAPVSGLTGAPGSRGDGLRIAQRLSAELGNMSEGWWCPAIRVPGELIDGEPLWRFVQAERSRPGSIMVDQSGRRFVNEAQNYNDVGRAMHSFEPTSFRFDRDPSWIIFDEEFRQTFPFGPVLPGQPIPDWWVLATSPVELAEKIGVPAEALAQTIERFNGFAAEGTDPDFHRGHTEYDKFVGDHSAASPSVRPLDASSLYAVPVRIGLLSTRGGARTDADGRVRHVDGGIIAGLYAAGSAAANPFGLAYPGAGGTLGAALVFGELAGMAAVRDGQPE